MKKILIPTDFSKNSKDYGLFQKLVLDTTVEEVSLETGIPLL